MDAFEFLETQARGEMALDAKDEQIARLLAVAVAANKVMGEEHSLTMYDDLRAALAAVEDLL